MKRIFDISMAFLALIVFLIPIIIIAIVVRFTSKGPVLYWSKRIGKDNQFFLMPKFRSMLIETPVVATDLLQSPDRWLTPVGSFLRKSSLDELPQIWSILRGDMSFVGPRPALFNQYDLITLRSEVFVHTLRPGLTGWAQVNGRDDLSTQEKVQFDLDYLKRRSFFLDFKILLMTCINVISWHNISH